MSGERATPRRFLHESYAAGVMCCSPYIAVSRMPRDGMRGEVRRVGDQAVGFASAAQPYFSSAFFSSAGSTGFSSTRSTRSA